MFRDAPAVAIPEKQTPGKKLVQTKLPWNVMPTQKTKKKSEPALNKKRKSLLDTPQHIKQNTTVEQWCLNHSANPEQQIRLSQLIEQHNLQQAAHQSNLEAMGIFEDTPILHAVIGVLDQLVLKCEKQITEEQDEKCCKKQKLVPVPRRVREMSWENRAMAVFFFHHPQLGRNNIALTARVLEMNPSTLKDWVHSKALRPKWAPYIPSLNASTVVSSLVPKKHQQKFADVEEKLPQSIMMEINHVNKMNESSSKQTKLFHFTEEQSVQKMVSRSRLEPDSTYVKRKAIRISIESKLGRPAKFPEEEKFVDDFIRLRWDRGNPCTLEEVVQSVRTHYKGSAASAKFEGVISKSENLRKFIERAMKRLRWSNRKVSIAQSVPQDWKGRALNDAQNIRETFLRNNVEVEVAADEVAMLFHATKDQLVVPTGVKRTGMLNPVENEKVGFTLVVAVERRSSQLLPPFGIMTGTFGGDLFNEWKTYTQSVLTFNKSHWMTQYTAVMFLTFLIRLFPGKTIGLVWDRSHTHYGEYVDQWIETHNEINPNNRIIVAFIEGGMTSIMQVPDICVNKPLKQHVRTLYCKYRDLVLSSVKDALKPGEKFKIPRERIWSFVEEAYRQINHSNLASRWIAEGFRLCGQDPYWSDLTAFDKHLNSLEENAIYKHMLAKNQTISL
jgi:hypothetical protein